MPGPAGILFLVVFLVLIPWGAYRSRAKVASLAAIPRVTYLRNVVWQQAAFLLLALLTAWREYIPLPVGRVDPFAVAIAVALAAAGVFAMRPVWERKVREGDKRLHLFAPRTREERAWWIAVSVAAGISEEIVWRGVVLGLLWWITDSWLAAAAVSSAAFGVAHAIQGWKSAALIGLIAMVVATFVHWAGGLLLAIGIHAAYDVVAGLTYGRLVANSEQRTANDSIPA